MVCLVVYQINEYLSSEIYHTDVYILYTHYGSDDTTRSSSRQTHAPKCFEGLTMDAAKKKAEDKLDEVIETSRLVKEMDGDTTFVVVGHKIKTFKEETV